MNLGHHPAVGAEVVAAARFYEQRVPGLGTDFLDEFDRSIAAIGAAPLTWRVVGGNKRRHLMKRFPYGIYNRITLDEVRILVRKHHSQHPDYGSRRMQAICLSALLSGSRRVHRFIPRSRPEPRGSVAPPEEKIKGQTD